MEASNEAARRAASLPTLLCHGLGRNILLINGTYRFNFFLGGSLHPPPIPKNHIEEVASY